MIYFKFLRRSTLLKIVLEVFWVSSTLRDI